MGHGYKIPKLRKGEKPRKSIAELIKERNDKRYKKFMEGLIR